MRHLALAALLALGACAGSETPHQQPDEPQAQAADDSDRVARIRALLLARHPGDLPDRQVLDRHPGAAASLRQLATSDDARIVRSRALLLLRHFPDAETQGLLVAVARDVTLPPAVRAAALRGMQGFDLARETALEAELVGRIADPEPMLSVAAVQTLATQPATMDRVRQAAGDPRLPEVTREAASRAIR